MGVPQYTILCFRGGCLYAGRQLPDFTSWLLCKIAGELTYCSSPFIHVVFCFLLCLQKNGPLIFPFYSFISLSKWITKMDNTLLSFVVVNGDLICHYEILFVFII